MPIYYTRLCVNYRRAIKTAAVASANSSALLYHRYGTGLAMDSRWARQNSNMCYTYTILFSSLSPIRFKEYTCPNYAITLYRTRAVHSQENVVYRYVCCGYREDQQRAQRTNEQLHEVWRYCDHIEHSACTSVWIMVRMYWESTARGVR